MAKRTSVRDFRSVRALLPDEVFALIEGSRSDATDPVSEDVWNGIMHLPDDVVLTTSNHHGRQLGALYTLWGDWIGAHGDEYDEPLFGVMLFFQRIYASFATSLQCSPVSPARLALPRSGQRPPTGRLEKRTSPRAQKLWLGRFSSRRLLADIGIGTQSRATMASYRRAGECRPLALIARRRTDGR
jgi:hypothetical protein